MQHVCVLCIPLTDAFEGLQLVVTNRSPEKAVQLAERFTLFSEVHQFIAKFSSW